MFHDHSYRKPKIWSLIFYKPSTYKRNLTLIYNIYWPRLLEIRISGISDTHKYLEFQFVLDKSPTPFWKVDIKHNLILETILAAISFILNGLFLIVLVENKDLVKRKRITYHVANLAVADTLYGLSRVCYYNVLLSPNEWTIEKSIPLLFYSIHLGFFFASEAAVLFMTIERSIVITKPLTWNAILPRKRMLLFMLCSWIAITLIIVLVYFFWVVDRFVRVAVHILCLGLLLSTVAVNIYMYRKLREINLISDSQDTSRHLKRKASILVLWLAVITIITCLPNSFMGLVSSVLTEYKLHYNLHVNLTDFYFLSILENLNFLVNPFVYIWRDRIYRNAFYRTFKIKTQF